MQGGYVDVQGVREEQIHVKAKYLKLDDDKDKNVSVFFCL